MTGAIVTGAVVIKAVFTGTFLIGAVVTGATVYKVRERDHGHKATFVWQSAVENKVIDKV